MLSTLRLMIRGRMGLILLCLALAGVAAVFFLRGGAAPQDKELVIVGFGGSYGDALRTEVIAPFERETGIKVRYDETCCSALSPVLASDGYAGDLAAGVDFGGLLSWEGQGYLLPNTEIEKIADSRGVPGNLRHPGILVTHQYAYVIAGHGANSPLPKTWAEFWDTKRFPGRRVLIRTSPAAQLEAALLADGVTPDHLYPLDADRAFASLDNLRSKGDIVFAGSPSDLVNLLATGDARYGIVYSNRALAAQMDGLPIAFSYEGALWTGNGYGLLKGARHVKAATTFLEFATRPAIAQAFSRKAGLISVTGGSLVKSGVSLDPVYWGEHRKALGDRWVGWLVQHKAP